MKKMSVNIKVTLAFYVFYFITYIFLRDRFSFFSFFQTVGTLTFLVLFFHKVKSVYYIGAVLFSCAALYGGNMFRLYKVIPFYDLILHTTSGCLLIFLGYYFLQNILRKHANEFIPKKVTLWFCWLFSVASAGIWEIWEFTVDQVFNLSSQLNSLTDTMTDMIVGVLGALAGIVILRYILNRKEKKISNVI